MKKSQNDSELLRFAADEGIIDLARMSEIMKIKKREEILRNHPYKIWQGKNGKWYTYLDDSSKANGRRLVKKSTQKAIEDAIVDRSIQPILRDVFDEWLENKVRREEIELSTRDRYQRDFDKYFEKIANRKVSGISEYEIEDFMLDAIYEYKMTPKAFSNMRTLVYGIFKLAKKMRLVDFSITSVVQDMEISRKAFRRKVEEPEKEVFSTEELPIVMDYLLEHKDIVNLGLLLIFKSGLRVGELAALKNADINFRTGVIHVCRTEIRYEDKNQPVYEVRDFPKTEAGIRDVILPTNYIWILKEIRSINPFGQYLFERNGERIRTYVFRSRLCYICKKLGIVKKSPHKARKTYGTMLLDGGVEESLIISQMGHTDIKTTKKHYYKDRLSKDEKRTDIDRVIGF